MRPAFAMQRCAYEELRMFQAFGFPTAYSLLGEPEVALQQAALVAFVRSEQHKHFSNASVCDYLPPPVC